ncbi:MAG: hypothetical protein NVSMB6_20970 [Burkholderiaceae bacterium]
MARGPYGYVRRFKGDKRAGDVGKLLRLKFGSGFSRPERFVVAFKSTVIAVDATILVNEACPPAASILLQNNIAWSAHCRHRVPDFQSYDTDTAVFKYGCHAGPKE